MLNKTNPTQLSIQTSTRRSPFAALKKASVAGARSGYFLPRTARNGAGEIIKTPGSYVCQILACKYKENEDGGLFFIAECKIIESNVEDRPAGTTASWVQRLNGQRKGAAQAAFSNLAQFIAAVFKISAEGEVAELVENAWFELTKQKLEIDQIAEAITSEQNPFRGEMISLVAKEITTKAGTPYTVHDWSPCFSPAPVLRDDESHAYAEAEE